MFIHNKTKTHVSEKLRVSNASIHNIPYLLWFRCRSIIVGFSCLSVNDDKPVALDLCSRTATFT